MKWLELSDDGMIVLPKFDRHMGTSAKKRMQKSERQSRYRESADKDAINEPDVDAFVDGDVDGATSTRGDKIRVDKKNSENNSNLFDSPTQKKKKIGNEITLPYSSQAFKEPWDDLMEMRKKKKAVNSDKALRLLIGQIQKFSSIEKEAIALLDTAIEHSWKTVYEPKGLFNKPNRDHEREEFNFPKGEELSNEM